MTVVQVSSWASCARARASSPRDLCSLRDFGNGYNQLLAAAYNLPPGVTAPACFSAPFNPFWDDATLVALHDVARGAGRDRQQGAHQP